MRHRPTLRANTSDQGYGVDLAPWRPSPVSHLLSQVQVTGRNGKAGLVHLPLARPVSRGRGTAAALAAAALLVLGAACGEEQSASVVTPPQGGSTPTVVSPAGIGQVVEPGPATPAPVVRALADDEVVVVGFLIEGAADDARVLRALERVEDEGGARVFSFGVGQSQGYGDLADVLGATGTPTVAVIGADGTLRNRFRGLVDAEILRQAVADAQGALPDAESGDGAAG